MDEVCVRCLCNTGHVMELGWPHLTVFCVLYACTSNYLLHLFLQMGKATQLVGVMNPVALKQMGQRQRQNILTSRKMRGRSNEKRPFLPPLPT